LTADETSADGIGDRLVKVLSHPLRIEILWLLEERVASPKELARATGAALGDVSYHVRYLTENSYIEVCDAKPRRGSIEHFYRLKPADQTEKAIRALLGQTIRALNGGTLAADSIQRLEWTALMLDERGWRELGELQSRWAGELAQLKAESARRLAKGATAGSPAVAAILGFATPSDLSRDWDASDADA
jgi:DNA-binding transcriptional ArsR family regulator